MEHLMTARIRNCAGSVDFPAISNFLYNLYQPNNCNGCWFQPIWEYAYTHPSFDKKSVSRIGIWEDAETIVGVAQYELSLGEAFFQLSPSYTHLKHEMFLYAEKHLTGINDIGEAYLKVFINDFDTEFEKLMQSSGYNRLPECDRPMSQLVIPDPFPSIHLPKGFQLKSLSDDNDLVKFDRLLWRGFGHPGEPPDDGPRKTKKMQSGPHYRKNLAIVVEAPDNVFASFSGRANACRLRITF